MVTLLAPGVLPCLGRGQSAGRGQLPLAPLALRRLSKAPRSFLHLLTIDSFAVPSRSPFSVRCEPPAPSPGSCRRRGEGLVGAEGDRHPCSLADAEPDDCSSPFLAHQTISALPSSWWSGRLSMATLLRDPQPHEESLPCKGCESQGRAVPPGAGGCTADPPPCSCRDAQRRSAASASGAAGRAGSRGCSAGRAPRSSGPAACSPSCPGPAGVLGRLGESTATAEAAAALGTPVSPRRGPCCAAQPMRLCQELHQGPAFP